jgi:type II secretory pathway pseudopilin PulG
MATGTGGFTLVEVLLAVLLVGLAIAALTASNYAYTQANGAAVDMTTAEYLIEQIRELTAAKTVDQIDSYGGSGTDWRAPINPPVDARGVSLGTAFSTWSQQIRVEKLQPDLNTPYTAADPPAVFYRVSVRALKNGREISSLSWIRARY